MLQKPQFNHRALLKYALVLPIAGLLTLCTQYNRDQPTIEVAKACKSITIDEKIYNLVEDQAEFPGGMVALSQYLKKSIRYPDAARKANIERRVFVSFVITKTGEIVNAGAIYSVGFGLDEEAIRVICQMPRWKPAQHEGEIVNMNYNMSVNFKL